jgi:hypothetical protein
VAFDGLPRRSAVNLRTVRLADFARWVGTEFRVADEPNLGVVLELVAAEPVPSRASAPRQEPFSLIFRGPEDRRLDQRIQALEHDELGQLGLFLVPIGPGANCRGLNYQSIFN